MLTLQQAIKERIAHAAIEVEQIEAEKAIRELELEIRTCHANLLAAKWLQEKTAVVIHPFKLEITTPNEDHNNVERRRYWISYRVNDAILLTCTAPAFLKKNEEGKFGLTFKDPSTWHDTFPSWRVIVLEKYNNTFPDFVTAAAWGLETYEELQAKAKAKAKAETIVIPPAEPFPF
jgi:hypothetical protein